jgi:hypothetical protein
VRLRSLSVSLHGTVHLLERRLAFGLGDGGVRLVATLSDTVV